MFLRPFCFSWKITENTPKCQSTENRKNTFLSTVTKYINWINTVLAEEIHIECNILQSQQTAVISFFKEILKLDSESLNIFDIFILIDNTRQLKVF